jgi:hypothetical protein
MRHSSRSTRAALFSAALGATLSSLITCALLASQPARAETILMGEQLTVRDSNVQHPAPGITMTEVEAQFGAPQERHPSVGEPPITRWDYAGFSVFFEHDRVIHTVVAPAEGPPTTTTASAATTGTATAAAAASATPATTPEAPAASAAAPIPGSDAEAPIDAARPSAPATATASASSPPLAPDAPLPPDTPVSAPPNSSADALP